VKRSVVCISHETGAGGAEIGRLVAERLGLRYVDEDIVSAAALKGGVGPDEIADEERRKSRLARILDELAADGGEAWALSGLAVPRASRGATSDELRALIRDAIEETAARGNAVIVAHAASHALGGARALRVLVTASRETRAQRVAESEGLDGSKAARTVEDADRARTDYLRRFHDVREELPTHYDLVLNTDHLPLEQAAALIVAAASQ
jgi:CMP/dCMP kinase